MSSICTNCLRLRQHAEAGSRRRDGSASRSSISAIRRRYAVRRDGAEQFAVAKPTVAELGAADARRIFQHGTETPAPVARRAGDDLQHLGGRGLLLQRLAEIVGALAQFVEQPRVLDGDHGLRGEILHQLDLLVGERPHLLAVDDDGADQLVVLEHRDPTRDRAPPMASAATPGIGSACSSTVMVRPPLVRNARPRRSLVAGLNGPRCVWNSTNAAGVPVRATRWNNLAVVQKQCAELGLADARRRSPAWPETPAPARRASWR